MNLQPKALIDFSQSIQDATGQLGKRSRRIYENDAKMFALWLAEKGLSAKETTRSVAKILTHSEQK